MTPVTVRPATPEDYEAVCAVVAATDRFHADLLPHRFQRVEGPARSRNWLAQLVEGEDGLLLLAQRGAEAIGFLEGQLQASPEPSLHVPRRWLKIEGVGVLEAHRRAGAGRALLDAAHAWARARGVGEVELSVHAANRGAVAFYERLGYTVAVHRLTRRL